MNGVHKTNILGVAAHDRRQLEPNQILGCQDCIQNTVVHDKPCATRNVAFDDPFQPMVYVRGHPRG